MKFHLPKKLFAAVMAAVVAPAFADDYQIVRKPITVNGTAAYEITLGSDYDPTYNMYGTGQYVKPGHVGAAKTGEYITEDVYITVDGAEGIAYLMGSSLEGGDVVGNKYITVKSGSVGTIYGLIHNPSRHDGQESTKLKEGQYEKGNTEYFSKKNDSTVYISVEGGKVNSILGGHNGSSDIKAEIKTMTEEELIAIQNDTDKSAIWAHGGDIYISISGGTVGGVQCVDDDKKPIFDETGAPVYEDAIRGAGGSYNSVDGKVSISISGTAEVTGDVYAGARNKYAYVGSTAVSISGGTINGNVFGGSSYDSDLNGTDYANVVKGNADVTLSGGTVTRNVYAAGDRDKVNGNTTVTIAGTGTQVGGTIYGGGIEAEVLGTRTLTVDSSYTGTQAYKVADFTNIAVNADATLAEMTAAEEGTDISIAEGKTLKLTGDKTYTAGNATGGTIYVDGANFELSSADSKLTSDVVLDKHASLDLNGAAVNNTIWVYGCSIKGAESFSGHLIVDGGELELTEPTSADKVTVTNGGSVTGGSLTANKVELIGTNDGATQPDVNTDLKVADNGVITLSGGAVLNVEGSLTLGTDVNIVVDGNYEVGTEIIKVSGDINQTEDIEITFGETKVVVQNGGVWLISRFDQNYADTFTVGNWGIITASRAFVDTVRGQRTNVGCIANGRGTAWAAVMGGNHDIAGSDINLTGAAVGADMKVGRSSSVGVALGYVDGDVKPGSLRSIDQDGTYLAVYGEHGLKKLDATSCLSLDWVAAYGNTESSVNGHGWEQNSLQLNSRLNWNKRINSKVCVNAFGGLEYFASNSNTVAGMKTGSIQSLRGEIGVGARYVACSTPSVYDNKSGLVLAKGCEKLVFNGEIRYINDLERSNPVIRMEGMSGGSTNPGRQGMGIEAGATYRINERWSASANYGFNAMDDSKEHRINAGAAYTF